MEETEVPQTMGVSGFASRIASVGLASPNKFEVEFSQLPFGVEGNMDLKSLNIMCESVSLAGRAVQSILDRQYGVNREVAYNGPTYTPITISFLCSSNYAEKKLFDRWNDKIVSIKDAWDVEYYDNYTGIMTVKTLDRDGVTLTHTQIYHECYPKTVAAVELNHSTQNSAVRLTVEMQYAYWTTSDLKLNDSRTERTTEETRKGQNLVTGRLG